MRIFLLTLLLPFLSMAQTQKEYQGLLWEISGNGLSEPSYLYGTMHVSNRVAFHLGDAFFEALESADIVALETNPETWVKDLTESSLYRDYIQGSFGGYRSYVPFYESFVPSEPLRVNWEYYLAHDQGMLNHLLYRLDKYEEDFAENTYLDLFIYQAGKKGNKTVIALEDFEESFKQTLLARKYDEDAVYMTSRQRQDIMGDFPSIQLLFEDAYRRGDLDLLDSLQSLLSPGKYFRKHMLDIRNMVMVDGMDTLMKNGVLFTGVGAAHLPGKMGVINLLRERGYTVEPKICTSENSLHKKEEIDEIIFEGETQLFTSDDGFITARVPGEMVKLLSQPIQENMFADMANGGFYSIRRISTFGLIKGKGPEDYLGKIDSLLFENIPGKILSKKEIQVSGFSALDIRNKTRSGDHQRYTIVFTPLEVIIFKVGGTGEFARSKQPQDFFSSISLNTAEKQDLFQPKFHGFEVNLPGNLRIQQYEGVFPDPTATFWAQSYNKGDYYAAGLRQYHDFEYIEEDDFELTFFIQSISEEEDLEIDSIYILSEKGHGQSRFELIHKNGSKLHGELHIEGPKYLFLLTNAENNLDREAFFNSFRFLPWKYQSEFSLQKDTLLQITMESPFELNDHKSFLSNIMNRYGDKDRDESFLYTLHEKNYTNPNNGEVLYAECQIFPKYKSYESLEDFWKSQLKYIEEYLELEIIQDSTLFTREGDVLSQGKLLVLSDSSSSRTITMKAVLENGALYVLTANLDQNGYESEFAKRALETFMPAEDTVIGLPITTSKANMFFEALDSKDSLEVAQAGESVNYVVFEEADLPRIIHYLENYEHDEFNRDFKLGLLSKLSVLNGVNHLDFLESYYMNHRDSSAYQFEILETLIRLRTKKATKKFTELILEDPPFSSKEFHYSGLFRTFQDSLELAAHLFPEILPLAEFEDYRSTIYGLLADLVEEGYISHSAYKSKYKTLLLYAKVELKKQITTDADQETYYNKTSSNYNLENYTTLLASFGRKKEVREFFGSLEKISNKAVLAELLPLIDPHYDVNSETWNRVADEPKTLFNLYSYLKEADKLYLLDSAFKSQPELAKSIFVQNRYSSYDSLVFIQSNPVEYDEQPTTVYFFRGKNDRSKHWQLIFVLLDESGFETGEYIFARTGESFNQEVDDLEEIINDSLKSLDLYHRNRAKGSLNANMYY